MASPELFARRLVMPIDLLGMLMMFASVPAGLFIQARALDANIPQDAPLAIESVKFSSPSQQLEWKPGVASEYESKPFFTAEPISMSVSLNRKIGSSEWDGSRFEASNKNLSSSKVTLQFPNKVADAGIIHSVLNSPNAGEYSFRLVPPGPVKHAITGRSITIPVSTGEKPVIRLIEDPVVVKKFSSKANRFFDGVDKKLTYQLELSPSVEELSRDVFINMRSSESNPSGVNVESVKKVGDGFEISVVPYLQKSGNEPEYLELGIRPGIGFKTTDGRTIVARKSIQADSKVEVVRSNFPKSVMPGVASEKDSIGTKTINPLPPALPPQLIVKGSGNATVGETISWQLSFPAQVDQTKVRGLLEYANAVEKGPSIGPIVVKPISSKEFVLETRAVASGEYRLQIKPGTDLASGSSPYRISAPVASDKSWRVMDAPMPPPLSPPVLVVSGSGNAKMGDTLAWKLTLPVQGEVSKVRSLEFVNASPTGPKFEAVNIEPVPGGKEYRLSTKAHAAGEYWLEIKAGNFLTSGSNPYKVSSSVQSDKKWLVAGPTTTDSGGSLAEETTESRRASVTRSTEFEIPEGKMLGSTIALFPDTKLWRKKDKELGDSMYFDPTKKYEGFDPARDTFILSRRSRVDGPSKWGQKYSRDPYPRLLYEAQDLLNVWNSLAVPERKKYFLAHGVKKVVLVWCDESNLDQYIKPSEMTPNPDCNLIVVGAGVKSARLDEAQRTIGTVLQLNERDPWILLPDSIRFMVNAVNRKR